MRKALVIALALALAAAAWWLSRPRPSAPADVSTPVPAPETPVSVPPAAPPGSFPGAARLNAPGRTAGDDLRLLDEVFRQYQILVKDPSGNPYGSNERITRALSGKNRAKLVFIPPGHPAINAQGELTDRWGTPLFFHALSGRDMEIRSAGPDRQLFTTDDVVRAPPARARHGGREETP